MWSNFHPCPTMSKLSILHFNDVYRVNPQKLVRPQTSEDCGSHWPSTSVWRIPWNDRCDTIRCITQWSSRCMVHRVQGRTRTLFRRRVFSLGRKLCNQRQPYGNTILARAKSLYRNSSVGTRAKRDRTRRFIDGWEELAMSCKVALLNTIITQETTISISVCKAIILKSRLILISAQKAIHIWPSWSKEPNS